MYIIIYIYIYIYSVCVCVCACVCGHTEELWYNETACLWMTIYIYTFGTTRMHIIVSKSVHQETEELTMSHKYLFAAFEKCALLVMKSGKRHLTDGIELPNQDKIRTLAENETYKYLGILEADIIKRVEMKNKFQKEYIRRTRKLLETKLSSRNLIKRNKYLGCTSR